MVLCSAGGNGSGRADTVINMPFLFLRISGAGSWQTVGTPAAMTDSYVPSGATSFNVSDASGFAVGDTVLVRRPVTAAWIHGLGMDTLVRNGQPHAWISAGSLINTDRVIAAIDGNRITLDVPSGTRFVLREAPILLIAGPFALWGWLNHTLPFNLARLVAAKDADLAKTYGF